MSGKERRAGGSGGGRVLGGDAGALPPVGGVMCAMPYVRKQAPLAWTGTAHALAWLIAENSWCEIRLQVIYDTPEMLLALLGQVENECVENNFQEC